MSTSLRYLDTAVQSVKAKSARHAFMSVIFAPSIVTSELRGALRKETAKTRG